MFNIDTTEFFYGIGGFNEVGLPAVLICASWDCDIESETFVEYSFLWSWIRTHLLYFSLDDPLASVDQIGWLRNRESIINAYLDHRKDVSVLDLFGHNLLHVAFLLGRQEDAQIIAKGGGSVVQHAAFTSSSRTPLHYAAAVGDEVGCRALEFEGMDVHDHNGQLPIFYAIRNLHYDLVDIMEKRM